MHMFNQCTNISNNANNVKINQLCNNILFSDNLKTSKKSFDNLMNNLRLIHNTYNASCHVKNIFNKSNINDVIEYTLSNSISIHNKYNKICKPINDPSYMIIAYLNNRSSLKTAQDIFKKEYFLSFINVNDKNIVNYIFSRMKIRILPL